ncbi:MAG: cytochrome c [Pseudolabrys sp.]
MLEVDHCDVLDPNQCASRTKPQKGCTMQMAGFKWLIIANTIIGFGACASAQGVDVGKMEYQSSCAACHGIDAKGNGPVSKDLKTRPADLTVLTKNNNGVFPHDRVYEMIDGRNSTISSHGTREMPVWGYRFTPPEAFRFKARILAVIDYLNRIQEK